MSFCRALRQWQAKSHAIRSFVEQAEDNAQLTLVYNETLSELTRFRELHRGFARNYISKWKYVPFPPCSRYMHEGCACLRFNHCCVFVCVAPYVVAVR